MKFVKYESCQRVPIKSWCDPVEEGAMEQAINLSKMPFVYRHVALMPDCHQGYGVPIGGVVACKDVIIPNAVGVDIGCGMTALQTNIPIKEVDVHQIENILTVIKQTIPVGVDHHEEEHEWEGFDNAPDIPIVQQELNSARKQLGTLGGGNHFIELQENEEAGKRLWVMLHSGSRNFGYKIAKEYHQKAVKLCELWYSDIPNKDLSFLPIGTKEAREYIKAMNFAVEFALANRLSMMNKIKEIIKSFLGEEELPPIMYDVCHNYARLENHFGRNVWVHRKGAISARYGETGIIPGSMGTCSYIVTGLGNVDSFQSCSHGAGRRMGRLEASRTLTVEECNRDMEGIFFQGWGRDRKGNVDLGEAPQAYKDINAVIDAERDLVTPIIKLTPIGVVKG